jgi:ketosteroid isomerase-like protein
MTTPKDLLKQLLLFLGTAPTRPSKAELTKFLHDDVAWTFPIGAGRGVGGTHNGIDAVAKLLSAIFTKVYNSESFEYQFHGFFGDSEFAAAHYCVKAETAWGATYENEYALLVRVRDGRISELWEYLDTAHADDQMYPSSPENAT